MFESIFWGRYASDKLVLSMVVALVGYYIIWTITDNQQLSAIIVGTLFFAFVVYSILKMEKSKFKEEKLNQIQNQQAIREIIEKNECPSCLKELPKGAVYCQNCGFDLNKISGN